VHTNYKTQQALLSESGVEYTYDSTLALVVLHALWSGDATRLKEWVHARGESQVTVLDTHDGLSVVDTEGVLSDSEVGFTVEQVQKNGGTLLMRTSGERAENLDMYQLNTTYFSALGCDEDASVLARAIQLFLPGIPQVYYVGLMAGKNDTDTFMKTGVGRDVNRHNYTLSEWETGLTQEVTRRVLFLMQLRNTHPAFQGTFALKGTGSDELVLHWQQGDMWAQAEVSLGSKKVVVRYVDEKGGVRDIRA
jgi:sucrose phosphorylase